MDVYFNNLGQILVDGVFLGELMRFCHDEVRILEVVVGFCKQQGWVKPQNMPTNIWTYIAIYIYY